MYAPSGAGPKFLIGADDDQKTYVNGTQISSGTQCCNRDNFETGGISMPAGWSRILFKVRNGSGGFNGTVSLRSGGDRGWNEGSVTRYSGSYGLGYEQDDWYPRIDVANFYGGSNPQPNANYLRGQQPAAQCQLLRQQHDGDGEWDGVRDGAGAVLEGDAL